jgi:hypothetical protein
VASASKSTPGSTIKIVMNELWASFLETKHLFNNGQRMAKAQVNFFGRESTFLMVQSQVFYIPALNVLMSQARILLCFTHSGCLLSPTHQGVNAIVVST